MAASWPSWDEASFRKQVDKCIEVVRMLLHNTRQPQYAADVPHVYLDKYMLADSLTCSFIEAVLVALQHLGVHKDQLRVMQSWISRRSASLRFKTESNAIFVRKVEREVRSDPNRVSSSNAFGHSESFTVTTVMSLGLQPPRSRWYRR
jgi:hypothetical protein